MSQRMRGRGDAIPRSPELLDAMGDCWRHLVAAATGVRPFGTAYHAIHLVTTAIDTLAFFITGVQHFYSITGSVPAGAPQFPAPRPTLARPDDADEPE